MTDTTSSIPLLALQKNDCICLHISKASLDCFLLLYQDIRTLFRTMVITCSWRRHRRGPQRGQTTASVARRQVTAASRGPSARFLPPSLSARLTRHRESPFTNACARLLPWQNARGQLAEKTQSARPSPSLESQPPLAEYPVGPLPLAEQKYQSKQTTDHPADRLSRSQIPISRTSWLSRRPERPVDCPRNLCLACTALLWPSCRTVHERRTYYTLNQ